MVANATGPGPATNGGDNIQTVTYDLNTGQARAGPLVISLGGGGGIGSALTYSPATGSIDPGTGITGFSSSTGRLKITLAGNTTFAGLPVGTDAQILYLMVVSGGFTLTLTANGSSSGSAFFASTSFVAQLDDCLQVFFDSGLNKWVIVP